jgi:hypothetical protein
MTHTVVSKWDKQKVLKSGELLDARSVHGS